MASQLSNPLTGDAPRSRLALVVLLILGSVIRLGIVWNTDLTSASYLSDDAYYYLSLGKNVAHGVGPTIDSLHTTTGFQPLWAAVVVLVYGLVPNGLVAAHVLQVIGAVIGLFIGLLLYLITLRLSASRRAALAAALFWGVSSTGIGNDIGLMETSLATLATLALVYVFFCYRTPRLTYRFLIGGLVAGLAFLARIDTLILLGSIFIVLIGCQLWIERRPLRSYRVPIAAFLAGCFLPVLPWFLYCARVNKSVLPESGVAIRQIALLLNGVLPPPFQFYVNNLQVFTATWVIQLPIISKTLGISSLSANFYTGTVLPDIAAAILSIGTVYLAGRSKNRLLAGMTFAWFIYALVMTFSYSVFIPANWFWPRYAVPLSTLFIPIALSVLHVSLRRMSIVGSSGAWRPALGHLVYLAIGFSLALSMPGYLLLTIHDDVSGSRTREFYDAAQYFNAKPDQPAITVGAFQSGTVGYFAQNFKVVNLDGKVNSDAYNAIATGNVWRYICSMNLDYLADWQNIIDALLISRAPKADWREDNLVLETQFNNHELVYRVNRANCPSTLVPSK